MAASHRTVHRHTQRGQTLVEFALVLPVFVMLIMGIIDTGRAVYAFNTISNAAREGARKAIIPTNSDSVVKQTVIDKADTLQLTTSNITVSARTPGQPVTVSVSYAFSPIVLLVAQAFGKDTINMYADATMTVEGNDGP